MGKYEFIDSYNNLKTIDLSTKFSGVFNGSDVNADADYIGVAPRDWDSSTLYNKKDIVRTVAPSPSFVVKYWACLENHTSGAWDSSKWFELTQAEEVPYDPGYNICALPRRIIKINLSYYPITLSITEADGSTTTQVIKADTRKKTFEISALATFTWGSSLITPVSVDALLFEGAYVLNDAIFNNLGSTSGLIKITWQNYRGSPASVQTLYSEYFNSSNNKPTYNGKSLPYGVDRNGNPVWPEDDASFHYFNGWTPTISTLTTNAVYTASYRRENRTYNIEFSNYPSNDYGSINSYYLGNIAYNTPIVVSGNTLTINNSTFTATPHSSTAQYNYYFSHWENRETREVITGNTSVVSSTLNKIQAVFTRLVRDYRINFEINGSGTVTEGSTGPSVSFTDAPYGSQISFSGNQLTVYDAATNSSKYFIANPNTGWAFSYPWMVPSATLTSTMPVGVNFIQNPQYTEVTFDAGISIKNAYVSLDNQGRNLLPSGSSFVSGSRVYFYAQLQDGAVPLRNWVQMDEQNLYRTGMASTVTGESYHLPDIISGLWITFTRGTGATIIVTNNSSFDVRISSFQYYTYADPDPYELEAVETAEEDNNKHTYSVSSISFGAVATIKVTVYGYVYTVSRKIS